MNTCTNFSVLQKQIENFLKNLENSVNYKTQILAHINAQISDEWQETFVPLLKKKNILEKDIELYNQYTKDFEFLNIIIEEKEWQNEINQYTQTLYDNLQKYYIDSQFSLEDKNDCLLEIQSGAGGDDAENLAQLLMKMYIKWSEKNHKQCNIIYTSESDHGIKNTLLHIKGENSYGFLKYETGIHRFVRYSPFNALKKRQTSFIAVYTYVEEDLSELVVEEDQLEYSFYKASGAGGQHVNKTESAVRIKHLPTGIIVNCQNERSQAMNKNIALKLLKIKLQKNQTLEQERKKQAIEKDSISWSNQIRSYILNPYELVKDLRTGYETKNIYEFLNGNLLQECLSYNVIQLNKK
jgi:peptide chain release factor 2